MCVWLPTSRPLERLSDHFISIVRVKVDICLSRVEVVRSRFTLMVIILRLKCCDKSLVCGVSFRCRDIRNNRVNSSYWLSIECIITQALTVCFRLFNLQINFVLQELLVLCKHLRPKRVQLNSFSQSFLNSTCHRLNILILGLHRCLNFLHFLFEPHNSI